jgi:hypothetical protein
MKRYKVTVTKTITMDFLFNSKDMFGAYDQLERWFQSEEGSAELDRRMKENSGNWIVSVPQETDEPCNTLIDNYYD